jgi:mRNA-degrading endonuclease RelE of RelBE toxin-antitoxin system
LTYQIEYSQEAIDHLRCLTARQRSLVFDAVDEQLTYEPTVETRNRKLMRPNPLAVYELRIQNLRVYYDVEETPEKIVVIRAGGQKIRNKVYLGEKEIPL